MPCATTDATIDTPIEPRDSLTHGYRPDSEEVLQETDHHRFGGGRCGDRHRGTHPPDPAVPTVERAAVLLDTVKQGDIVREVRGPERWCPSTSAGSPRRHRRVWNGCTPSRDATSAAVNCCSNSPTPTCRSRPCRRNSRRGRRRSISSTCAPICGVPSSRRRARWPPHAHNW